MLLPGLASEQLFLGDAFKKYGVGIEVVRTGRYKGAVEPFTNNQFSEDNRAQIQSLLDSRWEHYLAHNCNCEIDALGGPKRYI